MANKAADLPYKIIKVVQDNIEQLKHQPKHLAWCLMCYDQLHIACRYSGFDTDNPKYIFIDNPSKDWPTLNEYELELLYEAWGVTVSNNIPEDHCNGKIPKANMTLDEHIETMCHPEYRYKSLFPTRHSVCNYLLCTIGSGYNWNRDGYISEGRDGVDHAIFWGYSQAESEVDPKIVKRIKRICNDRRIRNHFERLYTTVVEYNRLTGSQKAKVIEVLSTSRIWAKTKMDALQIVRHVQNGTLPPDEELDRISALLHKHGIEFQKEKETREKTDREKAEEDGAFFYPFSSRYSKIATIPDNAHPSYIKEAMRMARLIVDGKGYTYGQKPGNEIGPANKEMLEVSQSVIAKWEPKGY